MIILTAKELKDSFYLLSETEMSEMDKKVFAHYYCDGIIRELAKINHWQIPERIEYWKKIKEDI